MHDHTPSSCRQPIIRFLRFLISPVKVFRYCLDGSDVCAVCGVPLTLPWVYFSPITNWFYAIMGGLIWVIPTKLPLPKLLTAIMLSLLFHHFISSILLAFVPWEAYDPQIRSSKSIYNSAKKELEKKAIYLTLGGLHGLALALLLF